MKQKHFIDSHKGATPVFILLLMWYYGAWANPTIWLYLALHGTYGILWVTKSLTFPDKQWEQPASIWFGLYAWAGLSLYWISPWLIITRNVIVPPWYMALCVTMFAFGVFLHFVSDMQKYIVLQLKPSLLTTGLWSRTRNPNYLGELLIYLGFGLLAMHWVPLAALGLFFVTVWVPNMLRKDRSLSRYPEFAGYKKRSGLFLPF